MPPGAIYVVVALLAAIENVFPPIPADTAVAIGAFVSGTGRVSTLGIFLVTWVANVSSAAGMYVLARRVGKPFLASRLGRRLVKPATLARLERLYRSYGSFGIFLSRFVPGARAIVPPFAGVAGLSAARALIPMAAASAIWYGTLTFLVARYVTEIHQIARVMDGLSTGGLVAAGAFVAIVVVLFVWKRRGPA
ncbi:MAG: DedA family protein [Gemmatimonadetes bacterium]|nr:DedA family protein [Gemmatimonadota bacterium]